MELVRFMELQSMLLIISGNTKVGGFDIIRNRDNGGGKEGKRIKKLKENTMSISENYCRENTGKVH